jgi:hypothetical protein
LNSWLDGLIVDIPPRRESRRIPCDLGAAQNSIAVLKGALNMSKRLLELPNGNLLDPDLIKGVVKFPKKGVTLRNEFNKMLDFIREADEVLQAAIVAEIRKVLEAERDWEQPDWFVVLSAARQAA